MDASSLLWHFGVKFDSVLMTWDLNKGDTLTKNLPKKEFLGKNESYVGEI